MVASEFSLLAFLILLVMVFSGKWLDPSKSRFYRRHPQNITNKIYTSIHTMSTGLLYVCLSKRCSDHDKGEFLPSVPGLQPTSPSVLFLPPISHLHLACKTALLAGMATLGWGWGSFSSFGLTKSFCLTREMSL